MEHWMYSIEWLKRGIPNAHFLIWMKDKICPTQIDSIISSKFPDPPKYSMPPSYHHQTQDMQNMWSIQSKLTMHV